MQIVTVTLAGKEYPLHPLPIRKARAVRERISGPVEKAIQAIRGIPQVELNDMQAISELLDAAKLILADSLDLCLEIMFEFSPELAADRERIETEAFDDEALTAFVEVVKMLYPFGGLVKSLTGLASRATSTN